MAKFRQIWSHWNLPTHLPLSHEKKFLSKSFMKDLLMLPPERSDSFYIIVLNVLFEVQAWFQSSESLFQIENDFLLKILFSKLQTKIIFNFWWASLWVVTTYLHWNGHCKKFKRTSKELFTKTFSRIWQIFQLQTLTVGNGFS